MALRTVYFLRHGDKEKIGHTLPGAPSDTQVPLSVKGRDQMGERGASLNLEGREVLGRHSLFTRTRQSLVLVLANALHAADRNEGFMLADDPGLGIDTAKQFSLDQLKAWKKGMQELGEEGNVQRWLNQGKERPDEMTWSPYQIACGLAQSLSQSVFETRADMTDKVEVKISHSGYMEALLCFLAQEQIDADPVTVEAAQFVDRIGGFFEMGGEGPVFEIDANPDQAKVELVLRGKRYDIDLEKLEAMANDYLNLIAPPEPPQPKGPRQLPVVR